MRRIAQLSTRLSAALHIRGMKQVELCARTGIPKSAMSQYVKGSITPKEDRISAIASALDINEAWLCGYDDVGMERDPFEAPFLSDSSGPEESISISRDEEIVSEYLSRLREAALSLNEENRQKLLDAAGYLLRHQKDS